MRPRLVRAAWIHSVALATVVATACGDMHSAPDGRDAPQATNAIDQHAPSADDVGNAAFDLGLPGGPIRLTDGVGIDPASGRRVGLARDFRLVGDFDGDGHDEAAAVLADSTGPQRTLFLAILDVRDGLVHTMASTTVGTMLQLRDARLSGRRIVLEVVRRGEGDEACCPSQNATMEWAFENPRLTLASTQTATRALSDLSGTRWYLRAFDHGDAAPDEPAVWLQLEGNRLAGNSGCNRFSGSVDPGARAGELRVGPLASTRMACAGPEAEVERRFLAALGRATSWGFYLGRLALTWRDDQSRERTLLFVPQGR